SPAQPTISCSFSQNPFTPGTDGASVTVTVNTVRHAGLPAAPAFRPAPPAIRGVWLALGAMFAFVLFTLVVRTPRRRPLIVGMTCVTVIVILGAMAACG